MNVLIIEDDVYLGTQISDIFKQRAFANRVTHMKTYQEFMWKHESLISYDIIVLDIMLWDDHEKTGIEILEYISSKNLSIPVIMISSISEYSFLENAFQKGAYDYVIKPFRVRELQIRVQRWFQNYILSEYFSLHKTLRYYDLEYNLSQYRFYICGKEIQLSRKDKYLLSLLLIHREKVLSSHFLAEKIWWYSDDIHKKNPRISILRLKEKLQSVGIDSWIHNLHSEWYMLKKTL